MIDIPEAVMNKARVAGAHRWVDEIAELVSSLCDRWSLEVVGSFDGGTEAVVLDVVRRDGSAAVLKLCVPRSFDAAGREIEALRLAGDGAVALHAYDRDRGALLLERLGPSMADLDLAYEERIDRLARAAAAFWKPLDEPDSLRLQSGADKAAWLAGEIERMWDATGRPCSKRARDMAIDCALSRGFAHDPQRAVLVHGDIHQWNALQAGDGRFKLVDPDGLWAEPECDLGVLMREDPAELMEEGPRNRAARLAEATQTDFDAIWEWGVAERVSTGLLCTEIGFQPVGSDMLRVADLIAAS